MNNRRFTIYKKFGFLLFIILCLLSISASSARAQSVDLIWQGNGYVPPFYQGRTLWSKQTKVSFLAISHGLGSSANLYYKWTKNGTVLGNLNGIGKNNFSYTDTILSRTQTVKVEILSDTDEVLASATVALTPVSPSLLVYENNPLYGFMFHKEVGGNYRLNESEITFSAFPLFFDVTSREDSSLVFAWRTNTGAVETGDSVTYRAPDDVSGSSQVSITVSNKDKITQEARKGFLVQFGEQ